MIWTLASKGKKGNNFTRFVNLGHILWLDTVYWMGMWVYPTPFCQLLLLDTRRLCKFGFEVSLPFFFQVDKLIMMLQLYTLHTRTSVSNSCSIYIWLVNTLFLLDSWEWDPPQTLAYPGILWRWGESCNLITWSPFVPCIEILGFHSEWASR